MHTPKFNTNHFDKLSELSMALLSLSSAHKLPDSVTATIQELNDEVEHIRAVSILSQVQCADALARVNGYSDYNSMVEESGQGFDFE